VWPRGVRGWQCDRSWEPLLKNKNNFQINLTLFDVSGFTN